MKAILLNQTICGISEERKRTGGKREARVWGLKGGMIQSMMIKKIKSWIVVFDGENCEVIRE